MEQIFGLDIRKAEALIYPSEMARGLLEKLGKKNQPSHVFSNGINTREFRPIARRRVRAIFTSDFNIPQNSVKLLFVGRLFPEKSVDTLIRAAPHILEKHPDMHIMIVGHGHQREKLEKLADELRREKIRHISRTCQRRRQTFGLQCQ